MTQLDVIAAWRAFREHSAKCEQCEDVRVRISRQADPKFFDSWHSLACSDGRLALERWHYDCQLVLEEGRHHEIRRSA